MKYVHSEQSKQNFPTDIGDDDGLEVTKSPRYNEFYGPLERELRSRAETALAGEISQPHANFLPLAIALSRFTARQAAKGDL